MSAYCTLKVEYGSKILYLKSYKRSKRTKPASN